MAWLSRQVEVALASVDLSLAQFRILSLLAASGEVASALAERLAVRPPSVTAVVDGLVARGLVARRPVEHDRRRITLELTEPGRQLLGKADTAADQRLAEMAASLGGTKADRAMGNLTLWQQAMLAHRDLAADRRCRPSPDGGEPVRRRARSGANGRSGT